MELPGNTLSEERRRVLITHWAEADARYKVVEGELAINATDPGLEDGDPLDGVFTLSARLAAGNASRGVVEFIELQIADCGLGKWEGAFGGDRET